MQSLTMAKDLRLTLDLLIARHKERPATPNDDAKLSFGEMIKCAGKHGVLPATAEGLRKISKVAPNWRDLVPFLDVFERQNTAQNIEYLGMMQRAVGRLQSAGIDSVILKGGAFVVEDQSNAPWRQLSDVDLLVSPQDVHRAASVLIEDEFHQNSDVAGFSEGLHHHYPALSEPSGKFVELHIRLMQSERDNPIRTEDILANSVPIERGGVTFHIPSPEHRMIHLFAHAQISNWGYVLKRIALKDVVDAVELSHRHQINWNVVNAAFKGIGAEAALNGFLAAARELLDLDTTLVAPRPDKTERWAQQAIASLTEPAPTWLATVRMTRQYLKEFTRNPYRLILVWRTLTNPARRAYLARVSKQRSS
jgi:hypothetical protein